MRCPECNDGWLDICGKCGFCEYCCDKFNCNGDENEEDDPDQLSFDFTDGM